MKNIQIILNTILSKDIFEYFIIDKALKIVNTSSTIYSCTHKIPQRGDSILEYLPELVGLELDIAQVFKKEKDSIQLKTVCKNNYYFNLYLDYYDDDSVLILLQNITEITNMQQKALQYSNETTLLKDTLQKIIDNQNTLVLVINHTDKIEFINKKLLEYLNVDEDDLYTNECVLYKKIVNHVTSYTELRDYITTHEVHIMLKDDIFNVELTDIDNALTLITFNPITKIFNKNMILENKIDRDSLTGTYKKSFFDKRIIEFITHKVQFALVVIDIDDFKAVNDTYGHLVGDEVLKEFVTVLKKYIREDDLLARWGGEEFLLALVMDNVEDVLHRVETIRKAVSEFNFQKVNHLTASFGIAWKVDCECDDLNTMLQRADKALYKAKNNGKNRVILKKLEIIDNKCIF